MTETPKSDKAPQSEEQLRLEAAPLMVMVCTGKAAGQGNTVCWLLQVLDDDRRITPQAPQLFPAKDLKHVWVGEIVEMKMEGTTYWPGTVRHLGVWPNESQRMEWQAAARAWETARRIEKETADEKRRILLKQHLEPLRNLYRNLPTLQAVSLLAEIIYYVEHGTTK